MSRRVQCLDRVRMKTERSTFGVTGQHTHNIQHTPSAFPCLSEKTPVSALKLPPPLTMEATSQELQVKMRIGLRGRFSSCPIRLEPRKGGSQAPPCVLFITKNCLEIFGGRGAIGHSTHQETASVYV